MGKAKSGPKRKRGDRYACGKLSLAFNIGTQALQGSTLLKRHNAGLFAEAAEQFLRWNRGAGRVLPGLTRRRGAERALYLKGS